MSEPLEPRGRNSKTTRVVAGFVMLFGFVTIMAGGSALFVKPAQELAGNVVPFVLWFNFLAGFFYVLAGTGMWRQQKWAAWLSVAIASLTVVVFVAFGGHVFSGGIYEPRTVKALTFRALVWLGLALWQRPLLKAD